MTNQKKLNLMSRNRKLNTHYLADKQKKYKAYCYTTLEIEEKIYESQ